MKKYKTSENGDESFAFVQGYTRGFFEYILSNDQITDSEFITKSFVKLFDTFQGLDEYEEAFFFVFFTMALEQQELKVKHLDKLILSMKEHSIIANDENLEELIEYLTAQLQKVYDNYMKNKGKAKL